MVISNLALQGCKCVLIKSVVSTCNYNMLYYKIVFFTMCLNILIYFRKLCLYYHQACILGVYKYAQILYMHANPSTLIFQCEFCKIYHISLILRIRRRLSLYYETEIAI